MDTLTIRKPDDWHVHIRDGAMLEAVLPFTARVFKRAIVMPNLSPDPITTTERLLAYRDRIRKAAGTSGFTPLMTYYLTDDSSPDEIAKGFIDGIAVAVKLYPAGATTNSANGVSDISKAYPVLAKMQEAGMPLLVHGEALKDAAGNDVALADREKVFLDSTLPHLLKDFPSLKIVLEHATTKDAIDFVRGDQSGRLASTITVHHLILNKDDVEASAHSPYFYCMPVIKSEADQKALRGAATSGDPHFFLGTDSAPHPEPAKHAEKPAAGVFTAPAALELYAEVFEEEGQLENLEAFASLNGPRFYGLPANEEKITLKKETWTVDSLVRTADGADIRPFGYHADPAKRLPIGWKLA